MDPLQIVWFKRDLRTADHQPLLQASRLGPVLPLLVVEPEFWQQADASARHWAFCAEGIVELRSELARLGQPLVVRVGAVEEVLERARRQFGVAGLWSHEETGNGWTYARDRRVAAWARVHGIPWQQIPQFGVIRRLSSRDGWARRWEARMAEPMAPPPVALAHLEGLAPGSIPSAADLALAPDPCPGRQRGGRREALALLESFLQQRGARYHRELSSPVTAFDSCSRLSAHLAWGTLSLREVVQASRRRGAALRALPAVERAEWPRALRGFEERLHWHCHFIQKLESQPDLEFRELHPLTAVDPSSAASNWLAAWCEGRTGLPFVDACMRALIATGWINFRMRAMLMSVASHHLELPWRTTGLHLARLFLDYEPGIHWSQCQMQSGTTGINTIRIYNPEKQRQDQDPGSEFVARWVPELGTATYPTPIVDHLAAAHLARDRLWGLRKDTESKDAARQIFQKHGSRNPAREGVSRSRASVTASPVVTDSSIGEQQTLDF